MRHVIRDGGSNAGGRSERTRIVALAATFLLLLVGVMVSAPGLITASASGATQVGNGHDDGNDDDGENHEHENECENHEGHDDDDNGDRAEHQDGNENDDENDDGDDSPCEVATLTVFKTPTNEHGGNLMPEDFQLLVDGQPQDQNVATTVTPDVSHEISEIDQPGYELLAVICRDDDTNEHLSGGETVTLAPGQHVTCEVVNEDITPTLVVHKEVVIDDGGLAQAEDFQMTLNGDAIAQDTVYDVVANEPTIVSEDDTVPGYAPSSVVCESDIADSPNNKSVTDTGAIDIDPMLGENIYCVITNDDVAPGLTVVKELDNADGGDEDVSDFALQVNGDLVVSGELIEYQVEVDLSISETQLPGWVASNVHCESSDPDSINNIDTSVDLGPAALATVSLQTGESVVCTITNDDIAPTVMIHKVVALGDKPASEFQMTLDGARVDQDTPSATLANTPIEVSEIADLDYEQSGDPVCTDDGTDAPLAYPLVLDEGQNATCTITNTLNSATITVTKDVTHPFGGTLTAADFQMRIDNVDVTQNEPHLVSAGAHEISELRRPGYEQTGIVCTDTSTDEIVGQDGTVSLVAGQDAACTVSNADIAPTLTVVKHVNPDNGGTASPESFQLMIDDAEVTQNEPHSLVAGSHLVTEADTIPGYRMVGIDCSDAGGPVPYDANTGGVNLVLAQDVTCIVTNQHDPIDLAITKTVDGATHIAGGAPFDYTITVDNLGPRDAEPTDITTLTDVVPDGLDFVSMPDNCAPIGQTLTCDIDPALLHVADAPVVIALTVQAAPDAASGVYRNVAFVDTPADPSCLGEGCVPVCDIEVPNNNVACADITITREAGLTIDKVDNVDIAVHPGDTYSYFMTVSNSGPSTFLANLTLTDDLPSELQLVSVDAPAPWNCNAVDPLVCTFESDLQANAATAVITIVVKLDVGFLGDVVLNQATTTAIVDPPAGIVVTAAGDETTSVVRQADVSIVKTAQSAGAVVGQPFDWTIVVTNNGPDTATSVQVSDAMPAEFTVLNAVTSVGSCVATLQTVQCDLGNMVNGASATITVRSAAVASSVLPVTNTATSSSGSSDPTAGNNTSSATTAVANNASEAPGIPAAPGSGAPTPQLPRTGGSSPVGPLTLASLLVAGGLFSLVIGRRRRTSTAQ